MELYRPGNAEYAGYDLRLYFGPLSDRYLSRPEALIKPGDLRRRERYYFIAPSRISLSFSPRVMLC